jgi:hypothetical protein
VHGECQPSIFRAVVMQTGLVLEPGGRLWDAAALDVDCASVLCGGHRFCLAVGCCDGAGPAGSGSW